MHCLRIKANKDRCIYCKLYTYVIFYPLATLQISTNGYMSLGTSFNGFTPQPLDTVSARHIICPFWADAMTLPGGNSAVFYRVLNKPFKVKGYSFTQGDIFRFVDSEIRARENVTDFEARWMLITTWYRLVPYGATSGVEVSDLFCSHKYVVFLAKFTLCHTSVFLSNSIGCICILQKQFPQQFLASITKLRFST